jgi:hypothetical protein
VSLYFLFVQFEFTHAVGPHAGRYVVESPAAVNDPVAPEQRTPREVRNRAAAGVQRDIGAADVLVISVTPAPAGRPRILRRARPADGSKPPAEVPLLLATFVKGTAPLGDEREAEQQLGGLRTSEPDQLPWVTDGLEVVNLAIRAYRAAAHDPYATEVTRRDARRVRIGYGSTEEVQEGRWRSAIELPPPPGRKASRLERLRPQEGVAAVLAGRSRVFDAEDMALRALIDLDNNRSRAAAFQIGAAMRMLPLAAQDGQLAPDLDALEPSVRRAAELEAVAGERALGAAEVAELESIIAAVNRVLDAWRYRSAE